MSALKARYAPLKFGPIELVGLMTDDGRCWVSARETNFLLHFAPFQNGLAIDKVQSLLGTSLTILDAEYYCEPVPCLSLLDFERLIIELAIAGHEPAMEWVRAFVGLGLAQIYADGFNVRLGQVVA